MRSSHATDARFIRLINEASLCRACATMHGSAPILSQLNGPPTARVVLVGEAPGRRGAARTLRPFSGDESGRRLDSLLDAAGWTREDVFITYAALCNPLDAAGRNRAPSRVEVANCRRWLDAQLRVVDPILVVALGAVALRALCAVEPHNLTLADASREPVRWGARHLAARYHPSPRAAIHRPIPQQLDDFRVLGEWLRRFSDGSAASQ